jgi:transcriptional regulator with XRE-family HTH domain
MSAKADTMRMQNDDWRFRLKAALDERDLSMREVSLRAGLAPGYVASLLGKEHKDPTISNLSAVCDAVGVSLPHVLYGFDITPEDQKIVAAMHESPSKRDAVITLIGEATRSQDA